MGACGLPTRCCSKFLTDFSSISIRMAKEQGISLTPTEITGMCGRLRCCLIYEYEMYAENRKQLPKRRITSYNVCYTKLLRIESFGDPSAACRAASGAGSSRRTEGLAGRSRSAALRLHPRRAARVITSYSIHYTKLYDAARS